MKVLPTYALHFSFVVILKRYRISVLILPLLFRLIIYLFIKYLLLLLLNFRAIHCNLYLIL